MVSAPSVLPARHVPSAPASANPDTDSTQVDEAVPIIAFCHLGWDWVWQRPQQFLSRFAKRHRVLFVEAYRSDVDTTRVDLRTPEGHPNVTVMQTHLPAARWADGRFIDAERRRVLRATLAGELQGRFGIEVRACSYFVHNQAPIESTVRR